MTITNIGVRTVHYERIRHLGMGRNGTRIIHQQLFTVWGKEK